MTQRRKEPKIHRTHVTGNNGQNYLRTNVHGWTVSDYLSDIQRTGATGVMDVFRHSPDGDQVHLFMVLVHQLPIDAEVLLESMSDCATRLIKEGFVHPPNPANLPPAEKRSPD
jgi:hypothetical protein